MKARFESKAKSYDTSSRIQKIAAKRLAEGIASRLQKNSALIADLGCGTGNLSIELLTRNDSIQIHCCDLSENMLTIATEKINSKRCTFHQSELPPQQNYDLIAASFSFQWFPNLPKSIEQCRKLLKPQGWLAFSLPVKGTFDHLEKAMSLANVKSGLPELPDEHQIIKLFKPEEVDFSIYELTDSFINTQAFLRTVHNIGATTKQKNLSPSQMRKILEIHDSLYEGEVTAKYRVLEIFVQGKSEL
jgi:malonyl-CoA O-methyltransferase